MQLTLQTLMAEVAEALLYGRVALSTRRSHNDYVSGNTSTPPSFYASSAGGKGSPTATPCHAPIIS